MTALALLLLAALGAATAASRLLGRLLLDTLALHRLNLLLCQDQGTVLEPTHGRLESAVRSRLLLLLATGRRKRVLDRLVVRAVVLGLLQVLDVALPLLGHHPETDLEGDLDLFFFLLQ